MRFKKTISIAAFLVLLFLSISQQSNAQSYSSFQAEINRILDQSRWQIGPFRIHPRIDFQLLQYEWNLFYQREDENPASDFNSMIAPEINIYLLIKDKFILRFTERPSYVHYYRYKEERRFENSMNSELKTLILNRFILSGSYSNQKYRGRPTSEFNIRANEYRENLMGSLFYETSRMTSIGVSFSQNKLSYDDITFSGQEVELSRILNRNEDNVGIEFNYRVFTESFLFITAERTSYDFESTEDFDRRSYSLQANTGIRFPLIGGITGTLSIGFKKIVPRNKNVDKNSGIVGNTGLNFKRGRFGARLEYSRDFPFSYWENNVFYIENRYLVGGSVYPLTFIRMDYNYSFGSSRYPELIPLNLDAENFELIRRKDNYQVHAFNFVVRIIKNTGLRIGVSHWARNSNYFGESRNRTYVDASLIFNF